MHIVYVDNIPILPSNSPKLYLSAHPNLQPPFFIGYAAHLFISMGSFTGRWPAYSRSPRSRQLVLVPQLEVPQLVSPSPCHSVNCLDEQI